MNKDFEFKTVPSFPSYWIAARPKVVFSLHLTTENLIQFFRDFIKNPACRENFYFRYRQDDASRVLDISGGLGVATDLPISSGNYINSYELYIAYVLKLYDLMFPDGNFSPQIAQVMEENLDLEFKNEHPLNNIKTQCNIFIAFCSNLLLNIAPKSDQFLVDITKSITDFVNRKISEYRDQNNHKIFSQQELIAWCKDSQQGIVSQENLYELLLALKEIQRVLQSEPERNIWDETSTLPSKLRMKSTLFLTSSGSSQPQELDIEETENAYLEDEEDFVEIHEEKHQPEKDLTIINLLSVTIIKNIIDIEALPDKDDNFEHLNSVLKKIVRDFLYKLAAVHENILGEEIVKEIGNILKKYSYFFPASDLALLKYRFDLFEEVESKDSDNESFFTTKESYLGKNKDILRGYFQDSTLNKIYLDQLLKFVLICMKSGSQLKVDPLSSVYVRLFFYIGIFAEEPDHLLKDLAELDEYKFYPSLKENIQVAIALQLMNKDGANIPKEFYSKLNSWLQENDFKWQSVSTMENISEAVKLIINKIFKFSLYCLNSPQTSNFAINGFDLLLQIIERIPRRFSEEILKISEELVINMLNKYRFMGLYEDDSYQKFIKLVYEVDNRHGHKFKNILNSFEKLNSLNSLDSKSFSSLKEKFKSEESGEIRKKLELMDDAKYYPLQYSKESKLLIESKEIDTQFSMWLQKNKRDSIHLLNFSNSTVVIFDNLLEFCSYNLQIDSVKAQSAIDYALQLLFRMQNHFIEQHIIAKFIFRLIQSCKYNLIKVLVIEQGTARLQKVLQGTKLIPNASMTALQKRYIKLELDLNVIQIIKFLKGDFSDTRVLKDLKQILPELEYQDLENKIQFLPRTIEFTGIASDIHKPEINKYQKWLKQNPITIFADEEEEPFAAHLFNHLLKYCQHLCDSQSENLEKTLSYAFKMLFQFYHRPIICWEQLFSDHTAVKYFLLQLYQKFPDKKKVILSALSKVDKTVICFATSNITETFEASLRYLDYIKEKSSLEEEKSSTIIFEYVTKFSDIDLDDLVETNLYLSNLLNLLKNYYEGSNLREQRSKICDDLTKLLTHQKAVKFRVLYANAFKNCDINNKFTLKPNANAFSQANLCLFPSSFYKIEIVTDWDSAQAVLRNEAGNSIAVYNKKGWNICFTDGKGGIDIIKANEGVFSKPTLSESDHAAIHQLVVDKCLPDETKPSLRDQYRLHEILIKSKLTSTIQEVKKPETYAEIIMEAVRQNTYPAEIIQTKFIAPDLNLRTSGADIVESIAEIYNDYPHKEILIKLHIEYILNSNKDRTTYKKILEAVGEKYPKILNDLYRYVVYSFEQEIKFEVKSSQTQIDISIFNTDKKEFGDKQARIFDNNLIIYSQELYSHISKFSFLDFDNETQCQAYFNILLQKAFEHINSLDFTSLQWPENINYVKKCLLNSLIERLNRDQRALSELLSVDQRAKANEYLIHLNSARVNDYPDKPPVYKKIIDHSNAPLMKNFTNLMFSNIEAKIEDSFLQLQDFLTILKECRQEEKNSINKNSLSEIEVEIIQEYIRYTSMPIHEYLVDFNKQRNQLILQRLANSLLKQLKSKGLISVSERIQDKIIASSLFILSKSQLPEFFSKTFDYQHAVFNEIQQGDGEPRDKSLDRFEDVLEPKKKALVDSYDLMAQQCLKFGKFDSINKFPPGGVTKIIFSILNADLNSVNAANLLKLIHSLYHEEILINNSSQTHYCTRYDLFNNENKNRIDNLVKEIYKEMEESDNIDIIIPYIEQVKRIPEFKNVNKTIRILGKLGADKKLDKRIIDSFFTKIYPSLNFSERYHCLTIINSHQPELLKMANLSTNTISLNIIGSREFITEILPQLPEETQEKYIKQLLGPNYTPEQKNVHFSLLSTARWGRTTNREMPKYFSEWCKNGLGMQVDYSYFINRNLMDHNVELSASKRKINYFLMSLAFYENENQVNSEVKLESLHSNLKSEMKNLLNDPQINTRTKRYYKKLFSQFFEDVIHQKFDEASLAITKLKELQSNDQTITPLIAAMQEYKNSYFKFLQSLSQFVDNFISRQSFDTLKQRKCSIDNLIKICFISNYYHLDDFERKGIMTALDSHIRNLRLEDKSTEVAGKLILKAQLTHLLLKEEDNLAFCDFEDFLITGLKLLTNPYFDFSDPPFDKLLADLLLKKMSTYQSNDYNWSKYKELMIVLSQVWNFDMLSAIKDKAASAYDPNEETELNQLLCHFLKKDPPVLDRIFFVGLDTVQKLEDIYKLLEDYANQLNTLSLTNRELNVHWQDIIRIVRENYRSHPDKLMINTKLVEISDRILKINTTNFISDNFPITLIGTDAQQRNIASILPPSTCSLISSVRG